MTGLQPCHVTPACLWAFGPGVHLAVNPRQVGVWESSGLHSSP